MIPAREEVPIKSFSVAAYVCRVTASGMDVLLVRRSQGYLGGTWQMVSGKIEKGETAWEAALREIREETGIVPDRFYSADKLEAFYEVSQNCINLVPIFVGFVDAEQEVQISHEHVESRWEPYGSLDHFVRFDHQAHTARWIFERFVQRQPFDFLRIEINEANKAVDPTPGNAPRNSGGSSDG